MFENIELAPNDPILGLTDEFKKDDRANKINLGVGVYKDETGATPILNSVIEAEKYLLENEKSKTYLGIKGLDGYDRLVQELLLGIDSDVINNKKIATAQSPGGTGALRIAADFYYKYSANKKVWVSSPTWANHNKVFSAAGLEIAQYEYYNKETNGLNFSAMLADLEQAKKGDLVLLHACCHNPTGIDPNKNQWQELSSLFAKKGLIPLFDIAYQGFATGLEEDVFGLREFTKLNHEILIANSFSKNFGLYNERIGGISFVGKDASTTKNAFSQILSIIRANYSNPPSHGALIVKTILSNPELKSKWISEVDMMRKRIKEMRELFVATLKSLNINQDFGFINEQNGMFSFSGLTKDQVLKLKKEFAIYIVGSGRISVAGITKNNMQPLCLAIKDVI